MLRTSHLTVTWKQTMRAWVAQLSIDYHSWTVRLILFLPRLPVQPDAITMPKDSTFFPLQTPLVAFMSHSQLLHVESRYATLLDYQIDSFIMPKDSTSFLLHTALVAFMSHSPLLQLHVESRYATFVAV